MKRMARDFIIVTVTALSLLAAIMLIDLCNKA